MHYKNTTLKEELNWLMAVINQFGDQALISNEQFEWQAGFPAPELDPQDESGYARLLRTFQFNAEERLILILALANHLTPTALDVFVAQPIPPAVGGKMLNRCFMPTGNTAMFILTQWQLDKRIRCMYLFASDHVFYSENLLSLGPVEAGESPLHGLLIPSRDLLDIVFKGERQKPDFDADFPAKLLTTKHQWDDLILSYSTWDGLNEIMAWINHGETLMEEWNMKQKLKRGYRALFYGPPGTGKTLTASLIGKHTGRDVYRIDLSMVVSKYIGETEKNLGKIFDRAEHKDWILFFDEADALFGKRTNVSDSHDRYANQEVSFLLQRIEDYNGVVILASNQKSNMDDAFTRRFQSIIYFPMPKNPEKVKLWTNAFPANVPLEPKINIQELASRYELSGGAIMNISRYASLMALQQNSEVIRMFDVEEGIRKELDKEGRIK